MPHSRQRLYRHLTALVALALVLTSLLPATRVAIAQTGANASEATSETFGYTIAWDTPWTAGGPAGPDVVTLADVGSAATLTIRGEAAGPAPIDRLQQEIDQVAYANGTAAEVTAQSDTAATAEWRSTQTSRLVTVIATPDNAALVIATLVAPANAFDDAIANTGSVTLDGQPLLGDTGDGTTRPGGDVTTIPGDASPTATEAAETPSPEATATATEVGGIRNTPQPMETAEATATATETETDTGEATQTPDIKLPTQAPLGGGVDGNTYTSPNFGYFLEWDEDYWEVADNGETSVEGYDELVLWGDDGALDIYAYNDYDGDPAACLAGEAEYFSEDPSVSDWEQAANADGDPIGGETADTAYGVYTFTLADDAGARTPDVPFAGYLECRDIGDGNVLVIFAFSTETRYNAFIDEALKVVDTIELHGEQAEPAATATPSDENEGTGVRPPADENGTPPADEERPGTPGRPGGIHDQGSEPGRTETPTPTPTERGPDNGDGEDTGNAIEGSVFTSPAFGFSLDIPATWTVEDQQLGATEETLVLNDGVSTLTLWATSDFDGDSLTQCVDFAAQAASQDLTVRVRTDGLPFAGSDDLSAFAAYAYTNGDTEYTYYIKCSWIEEGQSVLILIQDVPTEQYTDERRARREIENLIQMP